MLCRVRSLIGPPSVAGRIKGGVLVVVVLVVGGCSGSSSDSDPAEPASQISTAPVPHLSQRDAPFHMSVSQLSGKLSRSTRLHLKASAGRPVRQWLDAGFVGGAYPRGDFSQAYRAFTAGAVHSAMRDRSVLTNVRLGPSLADVAAKRRTAELSVLAVHGHPRGVTARVRLILLGIHQDGSRVTVRLAGDIYLTRTPAGAWKIFGYDLNRDTGSR
jgi:hypothetical protein